MEGQRDPLVIVFDLTLDPAFSIHKAVTGGIYAAHEPLTGFLGDVWDAIKGGVTDIWHGATDWFSGFLSSPVGRLIGGVVGTIASGGSLGPALLAGGLSALGLPGDQIIAKAGGVMAMLDKYIGEIGAILPTGLKDALGRVIAPIKGGLWGSFTDLWEKYKPLVEKWAEYVGPVVDRIRKIIGPLEKILPAEVGVVGLGDVWAEKRISGEILTDILKGPPEFGLMTDPSLSDYLVELHDLKRITPPIPPVSMPEFHLDHLAPEVHQWYKAVTGIPKILPAMEGVWDAIKDTFAIIKDSLIGMVNWMRYTFQETLNLIITGVGDVSRFIPSSVNYLTAKLTESVKWALGEARSIAGFYASQMLGWVEIVCEFFRTQFASLYSAIANVPLYVGEVLHKIAASIYQAIGALGGSIYQGITSLGEYIWKGFSSFTAMFQSVFTEYLPWFVNWFWGEIRALGAWVSEIAVPTILQGTKGAWLQVEQFFKRYTESAWGAAENVLRQFVPMTPEKAPTAAMGLLGVAIAFGMGAHTISTVTELAHPLKRMGLHYMAGFMADMGNFGTIAASTMGVLVAYSLRRPMGYYVNEVFRPTQPRQMDLMMMAVKPDISIETFRRGMAYEGYPEEWINAFQHTMYNEPRHFELSFMMEDASASPEWLFTKARRAGYTPEDAVTFVRGMLAKVTRTQRQDLYKQAFNTFKEGYMTRDQLESYLDALEIRTEGRGFCIAGAELAYRMDYINDMVTLLTNTYLADLLSEDDLKVSILSLGIEERKARLLFSKARIRKLPKVLRAEKKEVEKSMREVQATLQALYREQYRKKLITEEQYEAYLIEMGMEPTMAELTVTLEAARAYEIPVDEEARERERIAKRVQTQLVTLYKELFRRDLIDQLTLVGYLIAAGVDPELSLAIAETERVKGIPKPEEETEATA